MGWPDADIAVGADLVAALVAQQFPDLAGRSIVLCGEGFDNTSWRLGVDHVVRLPRRAAAVAPLELEGRWLAEMARHVTLATPLPLRKGAPSEDFPWPWLIGSWIDGHSGEEIVAEQNTRNAPALGTFLRELHRVAPAQAPVNPYRSVSLAERDDSFLVRLGDVRALVDESRLRALWKTACDAPPPPGPPVWLHGDFHPDNTVYREGLLVGVIDFGDLCAGDPATDLAGGLMALPYDALESFFLNYGGADDATMLRTLGWSVLFGLMMLELGVDVRPTYERLGRHALTNALRVAVSRQLL